MKTSAVLALHAPSLACIAGAAVTVAAGAHWGFFAVFLLLAFILSVSIEIK